MKTLLLSLLLVIGLQGFSQNQLGDNPKQFREYAQMIGQKTTDSTGKDGDLYIKRHDPMSHSFYIGHFKKDICDVFYVQPMTQDDSDFLLSVFTNPKNGYKKISDNEWRSDTGKHPVLMKLLQNNDPKAKIKTVFALSYAK